MLHCDHCTHVHMYRSNENFIANTKCSAVGYRINKKHLKNIGPIHHCEPPHAHSPDVASGTVARRLRIDVHDNADDDNDNA